MPCGVSNKYVSSHNLFCFIINSRYVLNCSCIQKYFDKKILKLNNLHVANLDHNELEFLQLKGLLDKGLIKPLYLS